MNKQIFPAPVAYEKIARNPVKREPVNGVLVDIIISIHNGLYVLKGCLSSVLQHTEGQYRIILINDKSDEPTTLFLREVALSNPSVELIENEQNIGYVRSVNIGIERYGTPYKILLNSDVAVPKGWLARLVEVAESDETIGLATPLASSGSGLSLHMPPGTNYLMVDEIIATTTQKRYPDACTVFGYCLLVTQELINAIGPFNTKFDPGYYEECDYQYRAKEAGFRSVVCDSLFVFHKMGSSFGKRRESILQKNKKLFHELWDKYYLDEFRVFDSKNELDYLRNKRSLELVPKFTHNYDIVFVLPALEQPNDFISLVVEVANTLLLKGINTSIVVIGKYLINIAHYINPYICTDTKTFLDIPYSSSVFVACDSGVVEATHMKFRETGAKLVFDLLPNSDLYNLLTQSGTETIENFSIYNVVDNFTNYFIDIFKRRV